MANILANTLRSGTSSGGSGDGDDDGQCCCIDLTAGVGGNTVACGTNQQPLLRLAVADRDIVNADLVRNTLDVTTASSLLGCLGGLELTTYASIVLVNR